MILHVYKMNQSDDLNEAGAWPDWEIEFEGPVNLLTLLRDNSIPIDAVCSGVGTCGKCAVNLVSDGPLDDPSAIDRKFFTEDQLQNGWRLACRYLANSDLSVYVNVQKQAMDVLTDLNLSNEAGDQQNLSLDADDRPVDLRVVSISPANTEDSRDDWQRLCDALATSDFTQMDDGSPKMDLNQISSPCISVRTLRDLHQVINNHSVVTVIQYANIVLSVRPGDTSSLPIYGICVDIGSTTLAAYLMELTTGALVKVASAVNPQSRFGGDVISRINHTVTVENGTRTMQALIVKALNDLIAQLTSEIGPSTELVQNIVLTGNTTMLHFLLGLESESIALAPFAPVILSSMTLTAEEAKLNVNGPVDLMAGISAYVGSDITAGILASGMRERDCWTLLLDIGTNGELALGNKDHIYTCATAAGPAFEGANIHQGCSALPGAIDDADFGVASLVRTIEGKTPVGICGSGVLSVTAQLVSSEVVDETGRLLDPDEIENEFLRSRVREIDGEIVFVLYESDDQKNQVVFTSKDVREVQLAKAAIRAGIDVLLSSAGLTCEDVETLFIAGGFGNYMDIPSAASIGLIPPCLQHRTKVIGNSAALGAAHYLLSKAARDQANEIATVAEYIELSTHPDFGDAFIEAMAFDPDELQMVLNS